MFAAPTGHKLRAMLESDTSATGIELADMVQSCVDKSLNYVRAALRRFASSQPNADALAHWLKPLHDAIERMYGQAVENTTDRRIPLNPFTRAVAGELKAMCDAPVSPAAEDLGQLAQSCVDKSMSHVQAGLEALFSKIPYPGANMRDITKDLKQVYNAICEMRCQEPGKWRGFV